MSLARATTPLLQLVEDEAPMRRFLRTFLSGAGYAMQEAATGEEALTLAVQSPPDLVILDLGLPDMDGQDVIRKLREWLKAPIIVLSVRDQDVQKIAALDHGADDYLTKPFSTGEDCWAPHPGEALRPCRGQTKRPRVADFRIGRLKGLTSRDRQGVCPRKPKVRLTPIEYKLLTTLWCINPAGC